MPNLDASPVHAAAARLLRSPRFAGRLVPEPAAFPSHEPVNAYRPILAPRARAIDIWETEYRHVLPDDAAILDWYRATGLRPYLDSLATDADRADFESALLSELPRLYRERAPGSVVMPFRRFFVIAYRD
jgi:trans-aconitate 2-methyltransferase